MENIHLKKVGAADLGEVTLLVGDPARVELISSQWDTHQLVSENREFILVTGTWKGTTVSICSTGIGVGSTEIAIIELIRSGAKKLVRLGGCGAWNDRLSAGDLLFNHAMVRDPGMLHQYVSDTYPAAADPDLLAQIKLQAENSGFRVHTGIGMTTQSYYLGQSREHGISNGPQPNKNWMDYWKERHVLNAEMESAVLFTLASLYQIPAANCLVVHVNRLNEQWVSDQDYQAMHQQAAKLVLDACVKIK
ncbi:nucleoside phosphorylase [Gracilibacillus phocaeensis]|uniref:nucleoside phosphorylase n=1 Tax=Gracilibacillus phocaeensis TaxID=2042304 RepID=UPI00102F4AAF|nr:nucleoside phosphorylase [Gracilibacillus phocaeensis]